jgi:hypothetical protein
VVANRADLAAQYQAILVKEKQRHEGETDVDHAVYCIGAHGPQHVAGRVQARDRAIVEQVRQAMGLAQCRRPPVVQRGAGHRDLQQPLRGADSSVVGIGHQRGQGRRLVRRLHHAQYQRRDEHQRTEQRRGRCGSQVAAAARLQHAQVQRPGGNAQDDGPEQRQQKALGDEQCARNDRQ